MDTFLAVTGDGFTLATTGFFVFPFSRALMARTSFWVKLVGVRGSIHQHQGDYKFHRVFAGANEALPTGSCKHFNIGIPAAPPQANGVTGRLFYQLSRGT